MLRITSSTTSMGDISDDHNGGAIGGGTDDAHDGIYGVVTEDYA